MKLENTAISAAPVCPMVPVPLKIQHGGNHLIAVVPTGICCSKCATCPNSYITVALCHFRAALKALDPVTTWRSDFGGILHKLLTDEKGKGPS
jgi:hypothetical protein